MAIEIVGHSKFIRFYNKRRTSFLSFIRGLQYCSSMCEKLWVILHLANSSLHLTFKKVSHRDLFMQICLFKCKDCSEVLFLILQIKWGFIWYFNKMNLALHSPLESSIIGSVNKQKRLIKKKLWYFVFQCAYSWVNRG